MSDEKKYWEWINHKEIDDMFDDLEHEPCDYITSGASKLPKREITEEDMEDIKEELSIENLGHILREQTLKKIQRAKDKQRREAKTLDSEDIEEAGFFEPDNIY